MPEPREEAAAPPVIAWLDGAPRIADSGVLAHAADLAAERRTGVLCVHSATEIPTGLPASANRHAALAAALDELDRMLDGHLLRLAVDPDQPEGPILALARHIGASDVITSTAATPDGRDLQETVAAGLPGRLHRADGPYAVAPGTVRTGAGTPYRVFTPFARAWRDVPVDAPYATAVERDEAVVLRHGAHAVPLVHPDRVDGDGLRADTPAPEAAARERIAAHVVTESAAHARWQEFVADGLSGYSAGRDVPAVDGTSQLSAALARGTVHPRTLLATLREGPVESAESAATVRTQLAWREFFGDKLAERPETSRVDADPRFAGYRWHESATDLAEWRAGRTGFPFVDAGMRQLAATGWMHNRVRMAVASFLVKDLHLRWQEGAQVFAEQLVDADLASNQLSWQWCAGTGFDAAPFFRVFNPQRQGERFDPRAEYIRRWVPELRELSAREIHRLPHHPEPRPADYPPPLVDHAEERREALRRWKEITTEENR